ncbi:pentatricopeptide repeat-containing protein At3g02490, mitochondrial-like [Phragmites australis]|uniref:pentatricopeptide repeat-containing protein At3g02490, mitochondrial-like n=1 Tax=Phragmites australis TaxID=29695 RepID=UPI002D77D284|nr:pentatricopeptide repeat-containing protein At3g02490, mitochondrial-like [Phragmites australis]
MLRAALTSGGGRGRHLPALLPHHRLLSGSSIAALFSQPSPPADPSAAIQSAGVDLSHADTIPALLLDPDLAGNYPAASRFFSWAASLPASAAALNSKSFNSMLQLAAANGDADRFWSLVASMRSKGYGISKPAFRAASESFRAKDMARDADLLQEAYAAHARNAAAAEVCKVLRAQDKDESSKLTMLSELGVEVTDELVALVMEKVGQLPRQAMVFFRWVEQLAGAGISWGKVYNAMARALGREDCIEEFREVLRKMRGKGLQMDRDVYVTVTHRFLKRKMVEDAVDLFRFMTGRPEKLSTEDFVFLLKKVVLTGDLDLKLVTRVVRYYRNAGNEVKASAFDAVLKSLRSVGRLGASGRVLRAMEEGGFAPDCADHKKAVLAMCNAANLEEAHKYLANVEESGYKLGPKIWSCLVQKYSLGENVDKAVSCFHEMFERSDNEDMGSALEVLVSGLYKKKGAKEAFKVLKNLVSEKAVVPWQTTYKYLIHKLIRQGYQKEAFEVLSLMKSNGFPPFIDPCIAQISKSGTVDDALGLLNAMSSKAFPSRTVYVHLFQALFKEGRHEVAQQLLSQSPASIQNHADVCDIFDRMKLEEPAAAALADG